MKKQFFYAAVALVALASCTSDDFVGENNNSPNPENGKSNAIVFSSGTKGTTRADIYGSYAAELLGNNFYVTGTKGTEQPTYPTPTLVFDNYLVNYGVNTAGKTESNTANWEYVGITPDGTNYVQLSTNPLQTIKYWDYSTDQYDFLAFSTGTFKAVSSETPAAGQIGVTRMAYGESLKDRGIAYTFYLPSVDAIKNAFITDITEVPKANYGNEVTLKFKNLGSKVRIALYETVPGYSVKDVVFYTVDGTNDFTDASKSTTATLISANTNGLPTNGKIEVYFPHVGVNNSPDATDPNTPKEDYNKAVGTVTALSSGATYTKYQGFGTLAAQLTGKESASTYEAVSEGGKDYLGRTLPTATFAGEANESFYQTVFPVSSSDPLTLRVDYKLVSTDGSGETIQVYGAKAVVPATYTKWLPNYAYTYVFKISDNTNGWTNPDGSDPAGLFPITFDAVVAEATDATGEQTTITTVATPSITTYQQGHNPNTDGKFTPANEYDNDGKDLFVQVMDNQTTSAVLVGTGTSTLPLLNAVKDGTPKYHASLLYKVSNPNATEAMVMDALQNRNANVTDYNTDVTGRNGITLYYNANIDNTVTEIENGVDDNAIEVTAGQAAKIDISELTAGTYAYVYDYSWESTSGAWSTSTTYSAKTNTKVYQPIVVTGGSAVGSKITGTEKNCISKDALDSKTADSYFTTDETPGAGEAVNSNDYVYFSRTKNGGASYNYSYVSVDGKERVPAGLMKVPVSELENATSSTVAVATTFYFEIYTRNNGKYAVKVIKIVD